MSKSTIPLIFIKDSKIIHTVQLILLVGEIILIYPTEYLIKIGIIIIINLSKIKVSKLEDKLNKFMQSVDKRFEN